MLDANTFGHEEIKKIIEFQEEHRGKLENLKMEVEIEEIEEDLKSCEGFCNTWAIRGNRSLINKSEKIA